MKHDYILPNGQATTNSRKYVSAWREDCDKLAVLFNGQRYAYNPSFSIAMQKGEILEIDAAVGRKLINLMDKCDKLEKENLKLKRRLKSQK